MARRRLGFPLSFPPSAVFNEDSKYGKLHAACKNYVVPLDTKAFLEIDTNLVIIRIDVIEIFLFIRCEICEIAATIANSICSDLSVCSNRTFEKRKFKWSKSENRYRGHC